MSYSRIKRLIEIIFALGLLIVISPILLAAIILIKLDSKGPVFYKQERMGLNGKVFSIIKLRSMRVDAEKHGPQWADKNDARVTRIGRLLRISRIDELPQLWNVIRGDMAFIGPRPERPVFIEKFAIEIPGFKQRLQVKPGLTGWAQVNGGYELSPKEKFALDMYYIQNQSFSLDLKILLRTIAVIFTGKGAR